MIHNYIGTTDTVDTTITDFKEGDYIIDTVTNDMLTWSGTGWIDVPSITTDTTLGMKDPLQALREEISDLQEEINRLYVILAEAGFDV